MHITETRSRDNWMAPKDSSLGRALIRAQRQDRVERRQRMRGAFEGEGMVEETKDRTLSSVVEWTSLDEFLSNALLEGRSFEAQRDAVEVIDPMRRAAQRVDASSSSSSSAAGASRLRSQAIQQMTIPRRPKWSREMTAKEVQTNENLAFLEWRRAVAA